MDTKKHIKICKKCHHIIDEQTVVCPYCNKKQISSLKYGLKMFFGYFFAFVSFVYIVEVVSNNETELFFALIITAIISILFFRSAKKDKKVKKRPLAKRKSNNTYSTNNINYTATQNSNDAAFRETRKLKSSPFGNGIVIDDINKRFFITKGSKSLTPVYNFSDIVDYQIIIKNKKSIKQKKHKRACAVVNETLDGGIGVPVGMGTSKSETVTNDGNIVIDVRFFGENGVDVITMLNPPRGAKNFLDNCITESKSIHQRMSNQTLSIADEIMKLKDLLDSSAITQEEFDRQKEKLFSI